MQKRILSVLFLVGLVVLGVSIVNRQERQLLQPKAVGETITFTPQSIDGNTVVIGPMRGYYKWRDQLEIIPDFVPAWDYYQRYNWDELETTKDGYQFDAQIKPDIEEAIAAGQKFSFRVRAILYKNNDSLLPQYIKNTSECVVTSGESVNMPVWDASGNDCFRARGNKLMMELGNWLRANNYMQQVAWVDIGMYGQFGEWACSWCASQASPTTKNEIIDWHVTSFGQDARLVMMAKTDPPDPVGYALTQSTKYPVGWRVDCLGEDGYFDFATHPDWTSVWTSSMRDRWQTAPVVTEFCANTTNIDTTERDVVAYHVSELSNNNFVSGDQTAQQNWWANLGATNQQRMLAVGRGAGYRLNLAGLTLPASLVANANFIVTADWTNTGNAPVYEDYVVRLQLRSGGQIIWQTDLAQNIKLVIPGTMQLGENPVLGNVAIGTYDVYLTVVDVTGVRRPLPLAIVGREADGAYKLGSIGVGVVAPTPLSGVTGTLSVPTPTTRFMGCNASCGRGSDCNAGLICELGFCRNPVCRADRDCTCDVATPTPLSAVTPTPTVVEKGNLVTAPTDGVIPWASPTLEGGLVVEAGDLGDLSVMAELTWWQKLVRWVVKIVTFGQF